MQEIKQSFKLTQIQLLDLIETFDRRADPRQHEPSPEYEIVSSDYYYADQYYSCVQTLAVPSSSTTVDENDSERCHAATALLHLFSRLCQASWVGIILHFERIQQTSTTAFPHDPPVWPEHQTHKQPAWVLRRNIIKVYSGSSSAPS